MAMVRLPHAQNRICFSRLVGCLSLTLVKTYRNKTVRNVWRNSIECFENPYPSSLISRISKWPNKMGRMPLAVLLTTIQSISVINNMRWNRNERKERVTLRRISNPNCRTSKTHCCRNILVAHVYLEAISAPIIKIIALESDVVVLLSIDLQPHSNGQ